MLSKNAERAAIAVVAFAILGPWVLLWVTARYLSRTDAAVKALVREVRWLDDPNRAKGDPDWSLFTDPRRGWD